MEIFVDKFWRKPDYIWCFCYKLFLVENSRAGQNHLTRNSKRAYHKGKSIDPNLRFGKPFWLSSVNYYILSTGITIACFFIIWGGLLAAEEETPWITAGIAAGLILIFTVILRELVFKRVYHKRLLAQKKLDYNLKPIYRQRARRNESNRLTLERNKAIIYEIESKSKKAKSTGKQAELHLEVFEMCNEYFRKSSRELDGLFKGSPRYEALRRGQSKLRSLHRFHLLSWAALESQHFAETAKVQVAINDRVENAQRALAVINTAIQFYPDDETLLQSTEAIKEFIVSIKVSHWMEQAERAAFKNQNQRAVNYFRDALFFLERENVWSPEREMLSEKINQRIEELKKKLLK